MHKNSRLTFYQLAILVFFTLLTLILLFPLSLNLAGTVPEPTDPLLNVWRMHWNVHAFLGGPDSLANLFNTNIFYPFPLTLAYSEHFLMLSALALPFLLGPNHLLGMNISVLVTFILSGYAMYLLVTAWTHQRWAGLVAGILFAFSPQRLGQLNHLELLVTQWLPLALLALHWTLTRPGRRYPILFGLCFNLQALSGFHFTLNLTLACALLALVYTLSGRVYWRWGLGLAAVLSILVTLGLNWPIWQMYLRFSDVMGAVRTPGEVRIYSAAFTDYLTAIPYNWLYGRTFYRWISASHQTQPLMPFGLVGALLALIGLLANSKRRTMNDEWRMTNGERRMANDEWRMTNGEQRPANGEWRMANGEQRMTNGERRMANGEQRTANDEWRMATPKSSILHPPSSILIFLSLLTLLGLLLSFGLNEGALGPNLTPVLRFSPYVWLYNHVAFFQGIRVPGRFGILVLIGLTALAGWGVAALLRTTHYALRTTHYVSHILLISLLTCLILFESWSAPLPSLEVVSGSQLEPVYRWLRQDTPPETVALELPFDGPSEFLYEYYSSYHWRRLANGGTGFTPPIYREMRQWFKTFPDARSVDVIQQLGLDLVILHSTAYKPEDWQRLLADLPLYLPAFSRVRQIGEALVLHVASPDCQAQPDQIEASLTPTPGLDGSTGAVLITYHNKGVAAFVADVRQASHLTFAGWPDKNFTEPLVTPAGEAQSILTPLPNETQANNLSGAWLATLDRVAPAKQTAPVVSPTAQEKIAAWQPLGLKFAAGPELLAYHLSPTNPTACSQLTLALNWAGGQAGDTTLIQLLDPFGRIIVEQTAQPWEDQQPETVEVQTLSLAGSLPAGRYGLRVYVRSADGQERLPITAEGVTIPTDQIPPLPLLVQPGPRPATWQTENAGPLLGGQIRWLGHQLDQTEVAAGDWLRFTLVWQAEQPVETDLTVFTQLIGPDGRVWGQWDNQPKGGWYSTSLWPPHQPVADDYTFPVSAETPPGSYRLIAGMYNSASQERWPVQTAAGITTDFVEVGTVQVKPAGYTSVEQPAGQ